LVPGVSLFYRQERFALRKQVSIVSGDPGFIEELVLSWRSSGPVPEYEVIAAQPEGELPVGCVAVLDGAGMLPQLAGDVTLAIVVAGEPVSGAMGAARRTVQLRRNAEWAKLAAGLALECVMCEQAMQQATCAEQKLRETERFCAMGKFMVAAQHELANALTSMIGHSELLLAEDGMPLELRQRMKTVHATSLRIYEILQRLSALDRELQLTERQAKQSRLQKPVGKVTSSEQIRGAS
jgi:signal transduction histidine kinase